MPYPKQYLFNLTQLQLHLILKIPVLYNMYQWSQILPPEQDAQIS